jgi:hypothetical protein
MISQITDKLMNIVTPSRWPRVARRLFVVFFPITVPLLLAAWVAVLGTFIGVCVMGMLWVILMEFINSMRILWER